MRSFPRSCQLDALNGGLRSLRMIAGYYGCRSIPAGEETQGLNSCTALFSGFLKKLYPVMQQELF